VGHDVVLVSGAVAQRPGYGGHAWVFLQYLLGFRRLGYDVLFVDWLSEEMCGGPVAGSANTRYLTGVMERFGLGDSFSLLDSGSGEAVAGIPRREVLRRAADAAFLLNVMGYLEDEEILAASQLRVFLDIDPGFPQMWRELGLADVLAGYDRFVTVGVNLGRSSCSIPTCGLDWITTRPPVVLEAWPPRPGGSRYTSVATWRGAFAPVEYEGHHYGVRAHELRKFAELPRRSALPFELALDIHPADSSDRELLLRNGWNLVDPILAAGEPETYRDYVGASRAEVMVAKQLYVVTRSGWFSDRSACYLASGKPVLAQDTRLDSLDPTGEGLLTFKTLEEAVTGAREIERDYPRHARAARELAEAHFDSDKVLGRLLARLGVT
jgi:hypothetical protein